MNIRDTISSFLDNNCSREELHIGSEESGHQQGKSVTLYSFEAIQELVKRDTGTRIAIVRELLVASSTRCSISQHYLPLAQRDMCGM